MFSIPKILQLDTLEQIISVSRTERLRLEFALGHEVLV